MKILYIIDVCVLKISFEASYNKILEFLPCDSNISNLHNLQRKIMQKTFKTSK